MAARGMGRREALRRVGALAAAPALTGWHPLVPVQEGESWAPRFFDAEESALVARLVEAIIPETETPAREPRRFTTTSTTP